MPETTESRMMAFRLKARHRAMIEDVAAHQGGLTTTRVIEWAIERLHADVEKDRKKNQKKSVPPS